MEIQLKAFLVERFITNINLKYLTTRVLKKMLSRKPQ